ncbi:MAG: hypothetical protein ACOC55_01880 [Candidatus Natronoplasma sp.]
MKSEDERKLEKARDLIDEVFAAEEDQGKVKFYLGSALDSLEEVID